MNAKFINGFSQICNLGIGSRELMQHLSEQIHSVLPLEMVAFQWTDGRYHPVDAFLDHPLLFEAYPRWRSEYYNWGEKEIIPTFSETLEQRISIVRFRHDEFRFINSRMYNEYFRPMGIRHFMRAVVDEGHRAIGMFTFFRCLEHGAFKDNEEALVRRLVPHVAHAIKTDGEEIGCDYSTDGEQGIALADVSGRVHFQCPVARRLLP